MPTEEKTIRIHDKKEAFEALFNECYAPLCLYAKRYIEEKEQREDLVSEVFALLWSKLDAELLSLRPETVLGYVKICVKNSCINHLKHLGHEQGYVDHVLAKSPIYEKDPDSVYSLDDLYEMLYDALEKLPKSHREVFMKSFYEGKSRAEISKELDISKKTVTRYKQKALELLRQELQDYLPILLLILSLFPRK